MRRVRSSILSAFCAVLSLLAWISDGRADDAVVTYADQGAAWTAQSRAQFYVGDQGSQMIPLAWLKALKQPDGGAFLADALSRYGYLPNPSPDNPAQLPVGFTLAGSSQGPMVGMTCSACHTRQITAQGKSYRIDGGPAIVDFQALLADLDSAVLGVLANDGAFLSFAQAVLGTQTPDPTAVALLRADVTVWSVRFHTLMTKALPKDHPWGPSRLDAVSMIYNRLTGLDIGEKPTYLIPGNIRLADAPARYPFLWNASRQSMTQWPGFADNGSDLLALARNLGEVYGVFGTFHPRKPTFPFAPINREYDADNSANYDGLLRMERLVTRIGAPQWPKSWPLNEDLVEKGRRIFNRTDDQGCVSCHGETKGPIRFGIDPFVNETWATPVMDVQTDRHEWDVLYRTAETGSLEGAYIPFFTNALCKQDTAFNVLATSVLGGIIQHYAPLVALAAPQPTAGIASDLRGSGALPQMAPGQINPAQAETARAGLSLPLTSLNVQQAQGLRSAFSTLAATPCTPPPRTYRYESRVLYGIWAAAPYLHNGSVPTLAELLKPPSQRVTSFKVGPAYDPVAVGLAVEQTKFDSTLVTTGCNALSSGNSNCGHDYGTKLSAPDKAALLEYLKVIKPPG